MVCVCCLSLLRPLVLQVRWSRPQLCDPSTAQVSSHTPPQHQNP